MDSLPAEVISWFLTQGVLGVTTILGFVLFFFERRLHAKEREEHLSTLRLITPLAQKFSDTMDVVMPLIMAQINRRDN